MSARASSVSGRGVVDEARRRRLDDDFDARRRLVLRRRNRLLGDRTRVDDGHSTANGDDVCDYGDARGRDCASDFD